MKMNSPIASPKPSADSPIRAIGEAGNVDSIVKGCAAANVVVVAGPAVVVVT